jgi:hypothetical protein
MLMRTFDTPEPIDADLDLEAGHLRIVATDRTDTVVDVRPMDEASMADVEAAELTRVDLVNGRLELTAPRQRGFGLLGPGLFGRPGAIDVVVELPSGSNVRGVNAYGDLIAEGQLGHCSLKTSAGNLRVDAAADLDLQTASGGIDVGRVTGRADLRTSSGDVRVRELQAMADIRTAAGDISVQRAGAGVNARTAYGKVRVGEGVRGTITLATSHGDVEIGIPEGTAAYVDAASNHGEVHNDLARSEQRPPSDEILTIRARTSHGNITIRRA